MDEPPPAVTWVLGLLVILGTLAVYSGAHVILTYPRKGVMLLSVVVGVVSLPYLFGWATIRLAEIWGDDSDG